MKLNIVTPVGRAVKTVVTRLGYDIHAVRTAVDNPLYELVRPIATYSPWNKDEAFLGTYKVIRTHTLVDRYRCFELWSLVAQTASLQGSLIEVGVWRGGTGSLIARQARLCRVRDPVYLCDTFTGTVKASAHDTDYKGGEHSDTSRTVVERLLSTLGLHNAIILEGVFPDDTAHAVEQDHFKFCHIDVDTYESARSITAWLWDRLIVGGVIVYDDYGTHGCEGITECVEEQRWLDDRLLIHNLNGHAIVVRIK